MYANPSTPMPEHLIACQGDQCDILSSMNAIQFVACLARGNFVRANRELPPHPPSEPPYLYCIDTYLYYIYTYVYCTYTVVRFCPNFWRILGLLGLYVLHARSMGPPLDDFGLQTVAWRQPAKSWFHLHQQKLSLY